MYVWIALKTKFPLRLAFFLWVPYFLFMGPTSTEFCKKKIKTKSHGTIHTFKNYFATVFLVINFQFLAISDIQTDPLECFLGTFITSD